MFWHLVGCCFDLSHWSDGEAEQEFLIYASATLLCYLTYFLKSKGYHLPPIKVDFISPLVSTWLVGAILLS